MPLYCTEPVWELVEGTLAHIKSAPIDKALTRTTKSRFIKLQLVKFYLSERASLAQTYHLPHCSLIATVNVLISDGRHSFGK